MLYKHFFALILIWYEGAVNQRSRNARHQTEIQQIQKRLNTFVANKDRRKSKNLKRNKLSEIDKRFRTTFFQNNDEPSYSKIDDTNLPPVEVLPEILEGIKMTTTTPETGAGIKI